MGPTGPCECTWDVTKDGKPGNLVTLCDAHREYMQSRREDFLGKLEKLATAEMESAKILSLKFLQENDPKIEKEAIKHLATATAFRACIEAGRKS